MDKNMKERLLKDLPEYLQDIVSHVQLLGCKILIIQHNYIVMRYDGYIFSIPYISEDTEEVSKEVYIKDMQDTITKDYLDKEVQNNIKEGQERATQKIDRYKYI